jgi:hypothetical protein
MGAINIRVFFSYKCPVYIGLKDSGTDELITATQKYALACEKHIIPLLAPIFLIEEGILAFYGGMLF